MWRWPTHLTLAGFDAYDVHMTDLQTGRANLKDFKGVVACGGFSYGDTLGAGIGWARSITFNPLLSEQFKAFFERTGYVWHSVSAMVVKCLPNWPTSFRVPKTGHVSRLTKASALKPACRWCEVLDSPSLFFAGMTGLRMPIAVAHGEGFANFSRRGNAKNVVSQMRFVDNHGQATERYPFNPNGSAGGLTAVTTANGRFTAMMPHTERVFRECADELD
jgi:phosphoribosylformylglycinamidine synthase